MQPETLPEGWQWVRFSDIAKQYSNHIHEPEEEAIDRYVGLDDLDPYSLRIKRWGDVAEGTSFTKSFQPGHVLFAKRRVYQKKAAVADFTGLCSGDIIVIEAKEERLLPELLPFIVQTDAFFDYAEKHSAGGLSPRTKWSSLAKFEMALPPMERQRELLELIRAVEQSVIANEAARSSLKHLRQSLLATLLIRGFGHDAFTETSIGTIPATWDIVPLQEAGEWLSGGTPSRKNESYWGGTIPWISPKDMKVDRIGEAEEAVTEAGAASGTRKIPPDTVLMVVRGMILAHTFPVALTTAEATFNQDIKALRTSDRLLPEFVLYWLQRQERFFLALVADSTHGTKRLPTEEIMTSLMPVPPREEQTKIVKAIREVERQGYALDSSARHLLQTKQALLQHTLLSPETGQLAKIGT